MDKVYYGPRPWMYEVRTLRATHAHPDIQEALPCLPFALYRYHGEFARATPTLARPPATVHKPPQIPQATYTDLS